MSKFDIDIVNYFDREELVAEICFDRNQWAEISPNKGKMLSAALCSSKQEMLGSFLTKKQ